MRKSKNRTLYSPSLINSILRLLASTDPWNYLIISLGSIIGFFLAKYFFIPGKYDNSNEKQIFGLAIIAITLAAAIIAKYLNDNKYKDNQTIKSYHQQLSINYRLSKLETLLSSGENHNASEIADAIYTRIKTESTEKIIEDLRSEIGKTNFTQRIYQNQKDTLERVYTEIDALRRRSTVNLVLGFFTAIAGVSALSMFVIYDSKEYNSLEVFAVAFLPRLSIVIIIEVFSYFFLRLYKSNLNEIKYFQNEATNIEFNFMALDVAINSNNQKSIDEIISNWIGTERNPLIDDNKYTRELKSEENEGKNARFSVDNFRDLINAISRNDSEKSSSR